MGKCKICGLKPCWHHKTGGCNWGDDCRKCHHLNCEVCDSVVETACPDHASICDGCCDCKHPRCSGCREPTNNYNKCENCGAPYCLDNCGGIFGMCESCDVGLYGSYAESNFHSGNRGDG